MAAFQRDPGIIAFEAFSGIRNDIPEHRFGLTDLAVGTNIDIDESGGIARRAGRTLVRAGATHSLWSNGALAMFVEGAQLKQLLPDYSAIVLRDGLSLGLPMSFVEVNGRVYFSNGAQTGVLDTGVVRSWGLPVPALPGVAVTTGAMPAGTYQYTVVGLRQDGQQSGAPLAGVVTLTANAGLVFTMPSATDPGIVAWALYLTTPNGDVLYRASVVPINTSAVSYIRDTTELALPLDTQFFSPPPAGHLLGYYRGRTFVAVNDTLFYSEPAAYELFDLRRFITLDSRITMFAPIEDRDNPGVYVATDRSTGWISGTDADSFKYVPGANYGVIPGTMAMVDGAMYTDHSTGARMLPMWLSVEGLCVGLPGGLAMNLTRSKYKFTVQGSGCALFKPDETQFVAVVNT